MLKPYFINCFLLTIPVLVWNMALTGELPAKYQPEIFGRNIPEFIVYGENISRGLIFLLTFLMPLNLGTKQQKTGFLIYVFGTALYFASWLALIFFPKSGWSTSMIGFMAPALTPLFWLAGIARIGDSLYFGLPFRRWIFPMAALVFLIFHITHAFLAFKNG